MNNKIFLYAISLNEIVENGSDLKKKRQHIKKFKYYLLSNILGTNVTSSCLNYSEKGKPYLVGREFSFSISHSKEYYAIAWIQQKIELGLDIESLSRVVSLRVIQKTLSPQQWLKFVSDGQNGVDFLYFWTQKEAFIKAKGLSVFMDLSKLSFKNIRGLLEQDLVVSTYDNEIYRMLPIRFDHQIGAICCNQLDVKTVELVKAI